MPSSQIGRYAGVGIEFSASIAAGFFIGRAIDSHFQTKGIATWIGFFLGVLSGFLLLVRTARQLEKDSVDDGQAGAKVSAPAKKLVSEDDQLTRKLEAVEKEIADDDAEHRS